jgi:heme oxygenase
MSENDLKELKDACNDLHHAVDKLTKISANTESKEMFFKLVKITNKVMQAMYELADDVIEHFGENNER